MSRRHDIRRAKAHRNYTTGEVAATFSVTLSTVSRWRREGLRSIDDRRPHLYAGKELAEFLGRKNKPRQPLPDGEIYCAPCKRGCVPAGGIADLVQRSCTTGDFRGVCPTCGKTIYRRVRLSEWRQKAGPLEVRYEDVTAPIVGIGDGSQTARLPEETLG